MEKTNWGKTFPCILSFKTVLTTQTNIIFSTQCMQNISIYKIQHKNWNIKKSIKLANKMQGRRKAEKVYGSTHKKFACKLYNI